MPANLTIRTKLIIILLTLGLIPSLVLGYISLSVSHTALSEQAFIHLISTRDAKKAQIERYFQDIRADISVLANSSHIVAALDGFSSTMEDGRINEAQYNYFESLEYGDSFKKFSQEYGYHDLMLITKAGDIVYSLKKESDFTRNVLKGELRDTHLGKHFRDGLESIVITDFKPYPPSENEPIAFAISPIVLLDQIEGVVVLKLSDEVINTIMTERSGLSETTEAYLVGPDNLMRSDSYLSPKTHTVKGSFSNPIEGKADTTASREALSGKNGNGLINGYRGVRVLSAYGPVTFGSTTYALIVEIDEKEAFRPISNLKRFMGAFAAALMLITVLASLYIAYKSTKPIRELTQSSIEIAAGNLDTEINVASNDELGVLAQSFTTMRDSIRQAHDVLEQRVEERTAELKKLSTAVEQSPASVVITDLRGTIEYVNSKFCEVTGYTIDEAIGQNPRILKSGKTPPEVYRGLWENLSSDGEWRGELLNKKKNGEEFWESASISPINNDKGEISHFVAVKQDITERKQMEAELIQAKHSAVEASQAKGDFLANMSHEIRTPMNAVIGMAHLALKTDLTPKQRDYLNKIQSSANSLLGIINDILDFSKIEAGKLDMETVEFHLDEVLDNLANLVTVKAQEKENLEVLFATDQEVPRFLVGDPLRLGQVLINLANNAVKFTESGEIVVSTELFEQDEAGLTIKFSVRDTGIGLTKDQIGKLFQSFSQADTSTTRKFGGTGLGLTISKRLVNMMGGEIWVDSEPGQGTTFSFTANFGLGKETVKKRLVPSSDLRGMKVLVVDDSATSRNILQDILESFSFEVSLAASGEEGLEEIQKADTDQPYELVLMDWKMPGLDGLEASERIKNHQTLSKIPSIILVTAYGREDIMRQAEKIGLDGFLIKPIGPSVLFDTITHAFGEGITRTPRISGRNEEIEDLKDIQGARVLLVEDNEINQQVAQEILAGAGLNVTVVNDGQEAVNAVKDSYYDAVLMDIQMPVMDGYEATRKIRERECGIRNAECGKGNSEIGMRNAETEQASNPQPPTSNIPIIAMTANAMVGDREKSLEAGMNDHVAKPIDTKELFSTLAKWIKPGDRKMQVDSAKEGSEDKAQPEDDSIPELPGISVADGLKKVGGNEKFYRKLLLQFLDTNRESANEIRAALEKKDQTLAVRLAHTVKGVAGTLGAGALAQVAGELEKALKTGETNELSALLHEFASHLNQVMQSIEKSEAGKIEKIGNGESSGQDPVDNAVVGPVIEELIDLMESDLVEARSRLEDLAEHLANSKLGEQFKTLENQMDIFDIPAALDTLKAIADELNLSWGEKG
jgi:PAS domain S-box-containing protein